MWVLWTLIFCTLFAAILLDEYYVGRRKPRFRIRRVCTWVKSEIVIWAFFSCLSWFNRISYSWENCEGPENPNAVHLRAVMRARGHCVVLQNCLLRNKPDCCTPEICCGLFLFLLDCSIRCLSHSSFLSGLNHTTHRIRFHKDRLRKKLHTVHKNVYTLFLRLKA